MQIRENLDLLFGFFSGSRRSGTTTLIEKVANENKVWVLCLTDMEASRIKNGVSLNKLMMKTMGDNRPILVDNHLMISILEQSKNLIDCLDNSLEKRNNALRIIKDAIYDLEETPMGVRSRRPSNSIKDLF